MSRILIVDDEPNLRSLIRKMLEPNGFEVDEASNGRVAICQFRERPADLVLCDLFMPDRDGFEVLGVLSGQFTGAKIISMSGGGRCGKWDLLAMAQQLGATAVLEKPFQQESLLKVIREVLPLKSS